MQCYHAMLRTEDLGSGSSWIIQNIYWGFDQSTYETCTNEISHYTVIIADSNLILIL